MAVKSFAKSGGSGCFYEPNFAVGSRAGRRRAPRPCLHPRHRDLSPPRSPPSRPIHERPRAWLNRQLLEHDPLEIGVDAMRRPISRNRRKEKYVLVSPHRLPHGQRRMASLPLLSSSHFSSTHSFRATSSFPSPTPTPTTPSNTSNQSRHHPHPATHGSTSTQPSSSLPRHFMGCDRTSRSQPIKKEPTPCPQPNPASSTFLSADLDYEYAFDEHVRLPHPIPRDRRRPPHAPRPVQLQ